MFSEDSKLLKFMPMIIIGMVVAIIAYMFLSQPEPRKRPRFERPVIVETMTVSEQDFQVYIETYGNIEAKTSGDLVSQVSGIIIEVSPKLESGRGFLKGDVLAKVDDKDYRIETTIAQAELANAQLALEQEKALAEQAKRDWNKINPNKQASSLVLRKPQVASAQAKLDAAKARLAKAKLALTRTNIVAPYDGKVIEKVADLGQLVSPNAPIAKILSSSSLEVRLPVPANKVQFLPAFTGEQKVELIADFGGFSQSWLASLDRADSVIDQTSRQWFVTAKIDGALIEKDPLLKVGQFVNARINGKQIDKAVIIPSRYIYDNQMVYLFNQGKLERRNVTIAWQGSEQSLIESGIQAGEQLIMTQLNFVADGAKLQLKGVKPKRDSFKAEQSKKNKKNQVKSEGATP